MEDGISNPLDLNPLRDSVGKNWKIAIAFDDPTVPWYGSVWSTAFNAVLKELRMAGVPKTI